MKQDKRSTVVNDAPLDVEGWTTRLQRKIKADGFDVPDPVVHYMAQRGHAADDNPEACLMRVIAYSSLKKEDITIATAAEALGETPEPPPVREFAPEEMDPIVGTDSSPRKDRRWRRTRIGQRTAPANTGVKPSQDSKKNGAMVGVFEGFSLSLAGVWAMLLGSAMVDFVCHLMRLITLSIPWMWWTVLVLNALTVLIPLDVYRFQRRKSNHSVRSRARLTTLLILESAALTVFLVILFGYQSLDVQTFHALGFLA